MPQHLVCPGCRSPLVIQDYAPAQLTCPRCLTRIHNPHPSAARPTPDAAKHARAIPIDPYPNLPLPGHPTPLTYRPPDFADAEAERDLRRSAYAIAALAITLGFASVTFLRSRSPGIGVALALATVFVIAVTIAHWRQVRLQSEPSAATDAGYRLVKGCAAALVIFFAVIALLLGLCAAIVVGGSHW